VVTLSALPSAASNAYTMVTRLVHTRLTGGDTPCTGAADRVVSSLA
jgi:hypothetical protein